MHGKFLDRTGKWSHLKDKTALLQKLQNGWLAQFDNSDLAEGFGWWFFSTNEFEIDLDPFWKEKLTDMHGLKRCTGLASIAYFFERLADDQIGSIRWQRLQRDKVACKIKAEVWRDAAKMLRHTVFD